MKKQRFFDMMKAFKESKIPNLQFFTQGFHINVTDEEMIDAVAGMTDAILFAIDSGSLNSPITTKSGSCLRALFKALVNQMHRKSEDFTTLLKWDTLMYLF